MLTMSVCPASCAMDRAVLPSWEECWFRAHGRDWGGGDSRDPQPQAPLLPPLPQRTPNTFISDTPALPFPQQLPLPQVGKPPPPLEGN